MKTRVVIFRILMVLYIAAVAYLLFWNSESIPSIPKELFGFPGDKVAHFALFLPFPALLLLCTEKMPRGFIDITATMAIVFLAGCGLAGLTELTQTLIPGRAAEWDDYKADILSTALCSVSAYIFLLGTSSKKHR